MIAMEDYLAILMIMQEVKKHEFRGGCCQGIAPTGMDAEVHFAKQWHAFRTNPQRYLQQAGYTDATQLWKVLMERVDFENFKRERNAKLLAG